MTDGGGDAMDRSQNGDIMIGPQPQDNSAALIQDAEMAEDEARSEATFRFAVPNFSKLKVGVREYYLNSYRSFFFTISTSKIYTYLINFILKY